MASRVGRTALGAFYRSPLGALGLGSVLPDDFTNTFEIRVEIDKVDVWEWDDVLVWPGQFLKTMAVDEVIVFNAGLEWVLDAGFLNASNPKLVASNMVPISGGGTQFAVARADSQNSTTGASSSWELAPAPWRVHNIGNWSYYNKYPVGGAPAPTDDAGINNQSSTSTGTLIEFDDATIPQGHIWVRTMADGDAPGAGEEVAGLLFEVHDGTSHHAPMFAITFSDTPTDPTLSGGQERLQFLVFGRVYLEGLS